MGTGQLGAEAILAAVAATTITNVTTANPANITSAAHGLVSGQTAVIAGVVGATQANGTWPVTYVDANHFTIPVNVTGTYTSGGTVTAALGNLQPGAVCTIKEPAGALSVLYTDLTGVTAAPNPTALDAAGNLLCWTAPGPKDVFVNGVSRRMLSVAPSTGVQLGFATTSTNFAMTSTLAGVPGLSIPVNVPTGSNLYIEAYLPQVFCNSGVANGFTGGIGGTNVSLFIQEDGATVASAALTLVVGGFAPMPIGVPRVPTAGAHTYTLVTQCSAGSTVTSYAGTGIVPYIRVIAG